MDGDPGDDPARERAIVEEAIAALAGGAAPDPDASADDHPGDRRRVRVVLDAIRAAR